MIVQADWNSVPVPVMIESFSHMDIKRAAAGGSYEVFRCTCN